MSVQAAVDYEATIAGGVGLALEMDREEVGAPGRDTAHGRVKNGLVVCDRCKVNTKEVDVYLTGAPIIVSPNSLTIPNNCICCELLRSLFNAHQM